MPKFNSPFMRAALLTAILGGFALTAQAQDMSGADQAVPAGQTKPMMKHGMQEVETRIQTLHDKLKITPDQEDAWGKVAQTMRDNEASIHDLIEDRHQNAASMTAVDDLQSYEKITQAHADGLQKMVSAFGDLYQSMPDDQKKNADAVFGSFEGHHGAKPMKHHK